MVPMPVSASAQHGHQCWAPVAPHLLFNAPPWTPFTFGTRKRRLGYNLGICLTIWLWCWRENICTVSSPFGVVSKSNPCGHNCNEVHYSLVTRWYDLNAKFWLCSVSIIKPPLFYLIKAVFRYVRFCSRNIWALSDFNHCSFIVFIFLSRTSGTSMCSCIYPVVLLPIPDITMSPSCWASRSLCKWNRLGYILEGSTEQWSTYISF